jgi:hypothetical protein
MANWANVERLGDPLSAGWQQNNLTWIEPVPGQRWQVYKDAAPAFEGLLRDIAATGYPLTSSGGFNYRTIRGGKRLSQHAFGTAIDLNAAANPRLQPGERVVTDLPSNIGDIAAKHGLEWGGAWNQPDAMHFEWRGGTVVPVAGPAVAGGSRPTAAGGALASLFGQPGQGGTAPQSASPQQALQSVFGDIVGPREPVSFASVLDNFNRRRQAADEAEQARQSRLAALFASMPA